MLDIDKARAVKRLKRLCFTQKNSVQNFRGVLDDTFKTALLPCGVERKSGRADGVHYDVLIPEICAKSRIILYVHGGSFVGGSCAAWHNFCASLATEASSLIIMPELRLAPEFPFPVAIEDVSVVFNYLSSMKQDIYIAADTSGASAAMGFFLKLPLEKRKKIPGILLFSPWLDISSNSAAFRSGAKKNKDPVLRPEVIKNCASLYTYEGNLENPQVSPVYASWEELEGLPPLFIQAGGGELLLQDMEIFAEKLKEGGFSCTLDIWPDMCHFFQFVEDYTADANVAVARAAFFIKNLSRFALCPDEDEENEFFAKTAPEQKSCLGLLRAAQDYKGGQE